MRRLSILLLTLTACGGSDQLTAAFEAGARAQPHVSLTAQTVPDAGPVVIPTATYAGPDGPKCCDANGQGVTSATCVNGSCTCSVGQFCLCDGVPSTFSCSDFCGSDAYMDPACTSAGWSCGGGLIKTDSCAPGTCWGEPGDCPCSLFCVDSQWRCVDVADGGSCW
jgi:hypothetical protein